MAAEDTILQPEYNRPTFYPTDGGVFPFVRTIDAADVADALDEADDKLIIGKLPKNVKLLGWRLYMGDFDTGTDSLHDLVIGDGTTTKRLVDASDIGQGGGIVDELDSTSDQASLGFVLDTDEYDVWIETSTAPAGAQDGDITVIIFLTAQLDAGEES